MALVFHITEQRAWEAAQSVGIYQHPSLTTEGFIHCSTADQVAWVANTFMQGQSGLVLLAIESARLQAELRYDKVTGVGTFPHIYGPINLDAVVKVLEFEPNAKGEFVLPVEAAER
jgi:uncharacterized protein (DUF952 family)